LNLENVPPRISVFLSRHGIVPGRRLRIEESSIKPEDALFVAGTLAENPGVQCARSRRTQNCIPALRIQTTRPHELQRPSSTAILCGTFLPRRSSGLQKALLLRQSRNDPAGKIAAALTRAGITKPEAWSAAGVPYQTVEVDENATALVRRLTTRDNRTTDHQTNPSRVSISLRPSY
jgi:hypothetical protein